MKDFGENQPSKELAECMHAAKQGSVVPDMEFHFQSNANVKLWSGTVKQFNNDDLLISKILESGVSKGMVVTQSCDLDKKSIPWITIVPVYEISLFPDIDVNKLGNYFVPLTAPWTLGTLWVADLRLEVPIEKSVLLGKSLVEGFKTKDEYHFFSKRLGDQRQRAAIPDEIIEYFIKPFFAEVAKMEENQIKIRSHIEEFRIIWYPKDLEFFFTLYLLNDVDEKLIDQDQVENLLDGLVKGFSANKIHLLGVESKTYENFSARNYLTSQPLGSYVS